jgi:hypothetical protein
MVGRLLSPWVNAANPTNIPPIHPLSHSPTPPILRLVLLLTLCGSLLGCSVFNPGPPAAVVQQAVAQKLWQTQSLLRAQLSGQALVESTFEVGKVKVNAHHPVSLGQVSAVEVEGTYTLKGGDLSRAQRRQLRPFDIYLQRGPEKDQWRLLEPTSTTAGWTAIPLTPAQAAPRGRRDNIAE